MCPPYITSSPQISRKVVLCQSLVHVAVVFLHGSDPSRRHSSERRWTDGLFSTGHSIADMDGGDGDMTLAFELEALKGLRDPQAVFTDARQWTNYVGVVSDKPTYVVTNFTRKHRIRQDFFSGPRSREESLVNIKDQFDTARHVFVGTEPEDEDLAAETDWEFVDLETAANAADWKLAAQQEEVEVQEDSHDDWP
jgi:hypothetical protein